jgi:succinylglutamate desuccinylase
MHIDQPRTELTCFKLNLGAAAQKAQAATQQSRRTVADVEDLLEDDEEDGEHNGQADTDPV